MTPQATLYPANWQTELRQSQLSIQQLLEHLELTGTSAAVSASSAAANQFPLLVPPAYLKRIRKGDPNDPLLLQVLPAAAELESHPGYTQDPLEEETSNPLPGLIHKYHGRVLLVLSGACAINCRYCFRRHFPYADNQLGGEKWQHVLAYLTERTDINEVIFSGGDPLATSDARLERMIKDLDAIPHLQTLRIHTRLPVVIPNRITEALANTLKTSRLNKVVVLHTNHAQEVDDQVVAAITTLKNSNATVLNQAVLLRGVNDSVEALKALSQTLFSAGVLPYYLFVLDAVAGAAHFDIPDSEAIQLVQALQREVPGYLLPRLAREIPGRPSKTLLGTHTP